jgi:transcriptional regulator with XRE-family HTH domain
MKTTARKGRAWALLSPKVLRKAREREGLSRKTLAEKLGVSQGAVQNWEADASTPSQEMQQKILDTLKIGAEPSAPAAPASERIANAFAAVVTDRVLNEALVPETDVSVAASGVVSAMINKGMLSTVDEIKAAIATISATFRG